MFQNPISEEIILLNYTFEGAGKWFPIISTDTDNSGRFETTWFPPATGQGNDTYAPAQKIINLDTIVHQEKYAFSVESNSTISSLAFESEKRELSFTVSDLNGTKGYVKVTVAKSIIDDVNAIEVKLNGMENNFSSSSLDDSWQIYFTYFHSTPDVLVNFSVPS